MQHAEEKIAAIPADRGQERGDAESAERIDGSSPTVPRLRVLFRAPVISGHQDE